LILTIDGETKTINKGNPFTASGKLISYSVKVEDKPASFNYYTQLDFLNELRAYMQQAKMIVGFNVKFDFNWFRRYGIVPPDRIRVWDCQIAEFIITGQQGSYPSLDDCLKKYGLPSKFDKVKEYWDLGLDTDAIPEEVLEEYGNGDVDLTYQLYLAQKAVMTEAQIRLLMVSGLDLIVLAEMEFNGIQFDVDLCKTKEQEATRKLTGIQTQLLSYSVDPDINLDSGQQLSCFLYGGKYESITVDSVEDRVYQSGPRKGQVYQKNNYKTTVHEFQPIFRPLPKTEYKLPITVGEKEYKVYQAGASVLSRLKATSKKQREIIALLLDRAEVAKLLDTYYGKLPALLEKMEWGNYLHGQYNQCVAATGRLSSSAPNMQNFSGEVDALLVSRYA
jgi:DNA polymerase I-like protein with 3'-5' exonuclease and polymerase domains